MREEAMSKTKMYTYTYRNAHILSRFTIFIAENIYQNVKKKKKRKKANLSSLNDDENNVSSMLRTVVIGTEDSLTEFSRIIYGTTD